MFHHIFRPVILLHHLKTVASVAGSYMLSLDSSNSCPRPQRTDRVFHFLHRPHRLASRHSQQPQTRVGCQYQHNIHHILSYSKMTREDTEHKDTFCHESCGRSATWSSSWRTSMPLACTCAVSHLRRIHTCYPEGWDQVVAPLAAIIDIMS